MKRMVNLTLVLAAFNGGLICRAAVLRTDAVRPDAAVNPIGAPILPLSAVAAVPAPALAEVPVAAAALDVAPAAPAAAAVQTYDGMTQSVSPVVSYRVPMSDEQAKIDEARARGVQMSQLAASLDAEFRGKNGQIVIDANENANYHAVAFRDAAGRPTIALTPDVVENGSWAFMMAMITGRQTNFNDWYQAIPASVERMAVDQAHVAMSFAEATNGSMNAWSTNLDFSSGGTSYVWSWYEQLFHAATGQAGFVNSGFYTWLRDTTAKQLSSDPSYQYSIYERFTGNYYRPGTPLNGTPIPANVARLSQAQNDAATQRAYGSDENGDNAANTNLLGYIRAWFARKGNA